MSKRRGRAAAVAVAALVLAACGGDDDASRTSADRRVPSTTSTAVIETTTSSTAAPPVATTAATGRSPSAQGARGANSASSRTASSPAFAAPGRYRYVSTGSFSSLVTGHQPRHGESTLTVDPPTGRDQRSLRQSQDRTVEQVLRIQDDGAYLVALVQTSQGLRKEFRPDPPALAVPFGAPVGRAWSWRMASTDGRTTVDTTLRITGTETLDVGGEAVPVVVVEAAVTTGGDVVATGRQVLWVSERHRLVVKQRETTDGRFGTVAFRLESTDTLVSTRPA